MSATATRSPAGRAARAALVLLALSAVPAHAQVPPSAQWHGMWGGDREPDAAVLRDAAHWDGLWRRIGKEAPAPFDPAASIAVYIALGRRPTGGYGAQVISSSVRGPKLVVRYREYSPKPDSIVAEAISYPWVVALLPRSDLPVLFEKEEPQNPPTKP